MSVGYLTACADGILAAAQAALVEATTGHAPPGTAYLSHGEPVPDHCGEVAVWLENVVHEPLRGDGEQSCHIVASPTFVISLFRCVTNLRSGRNPFPSSDQLDSDADDLLVDLWAILTELYDRIAANTLIPGLDDPCDVYIGEVIPLDTEGDVAGWRIPVTITANDQGPVGS